MFLLWETEFLIMWIRHNKQKCEKHGIHTEKVNEWRDPFKGRER